MATSSGVQSRNFGFSPPSRGYGYGYDDEDHPWGVTSSSSFSSSRPAAIDSVISRNPPSAMNTSRISRPVTWGGPGYSTPSPDTPSSDGHARELALPANYQLAWERICAAKPVDPYSSSESDSDISLGQLHRFLTGPGGLGASTSEKIVNLCCTGPKCSRYEFFQALALLRQAQDDRALDLKKASNELESGDVESPSINFESIPATVSTVHTFPPPPPPMSPGPDSRPAGPAREMSDPWHSSSLGATNNAAHAPAPARFSQPRDGLPSSGTIGFNSAFRGFASSSSSDAGRSKKGSSSTNGDHADDDRGFASSSSRILDGSMTASRFRSRANVTGGERPFSYVSEAGEVAAAVAGTEDPEATLPVDEVTVRLRSELAGFIIKHNVYVVSSSLRGSSVTRRYSDWVWLAECLVKRYPFRCLPVLPPKRIAIPMAGRHLSADDQFIERRRRGLERYLSVLTSHPVLRQDKLVNVFFTESKPLSDWRSSAPALYLDEEGLTTVLDEVEQMSIPDDLDDKLAQQRKAVPEMLERWTAIVNLVDRIVKRKDAAAADYSRLNFSLLSLVESSNKRWRPESDNRKVTEQGMSRVGEAVQDHADMLSARSSATSIATLEALKYQRDLVCSFRDLLVRLDRLLPDQVEGLKRRIDISTRRAASLRREERPNWEQEYEKLISQVASDSAMVEKLMNRRVHTRKTIWEEMVWMHWRYRELEEAWRRWVREEVVFSQSVLRNWELLGMKLEL